MSRVWRRVFKKLGKGLWIFSKFFAGWAAGCAVTIGALYLVGVRNPDALYTIGSLTPIIIGFVYIIVKEMYTDARDEVERENRRMMNSISGKY